MTELTVLPMGAGQDSTAILLEWIYDEGVIKCHLSQESYQR